MKVRIHILRPVVIAAWSLVLLQPGGNTRAATSSPDGELRRAFPIEYASASYLASVINDVYGAGETLLTPDQIYGFRRSGLSDLSAMADAGVIASDSPFGVKADYDDYSNTLIVRASSEQLQEVAALIAEVDHPNQPSLTPYVIPLSFIRANDMVPVVQGILDGTTATGRAAEASREASGTVSAYIETNSLVIVTDQDTIETVESVLGQLDCASVYRDAEQFGPLVEVDAP